MDAIIQFMQTSVSFIVPMIILLGLLIFVHELGHFLIAKYYKVRVEVFSLGFGPKIFTFRKGETTYAISAIPLGGYVKMFGDDPTAEVPEDQRGGSFTHKPVGQRIAVVLAGPLMNFFFAILLFAGVAVIGEQIILPKIGDIKEGTAAYEAGFRSGDKIVKVGGSDVNSWEQVQKAVEGGAGQTLSVEVQRAGNSEAAQLKVSPVKVANKNVLSWQSDVGEVDGLGLSARAPIIGVKDTAGPAAQAGLKSGDLVTAINGQEIHRWREFIDQLGAGLNSESLAVKVIRASGEGKEAKEDTLTLTVPVSAQLKGLGGEQALAALGLESPDLYLAKVIKQSPADNAGLKAGDKIVEINGQAVTTFDQVQSIVGSFKTDGGPLSMVVLRDGQPQKISVSPEKKERLTAQGQHEERFAIGIVPMIMEAVPETSVVKTLNPLSALYRGTEQTIKWTNLTALSFVRLFQGRVSAKNIGGFLSIGQMAQKSWEVGISPFLNMMAIISINLFILNLLPVPVLDGGHLVFMSIEALRGAPLSMRKMEIAQQVGMILLLGLMVFALYNDVSRFISTAW